MNNLINPNAIIASVEEYQKQNISTLSSLGQITANDFKSIIFVCRMSLFNDTVKNDCRVLIITDNWVTITSPKSFKVSALYHLSSISSIFSTSETIQKFEASYTSIEFSVKTYEDKERRNRKYTNLGSLTENVHLRVSGPSNLAHFLELASRNCDIRAGFQRTLIWDDRDLVLSRTAIKQIIELSIKLNRFYTDPLSFRNLTCSNNLHANIIDSRRLIKDLSGLCLRNYSVKSLLWENSHLYIVLFNHIEHGFIKIKELKTRLVKTALEIDYEFYTISELIGNQVEDLRLTIQHLFSCLRMMRNMLADSTMFRNQVIECLDHRKQGIAELVKVLIAGSYENCQHWTDSSGLLTSLDVPIGQEVETPVFEQDTKTEFVKCTIPLIHALDKIKRVSTMIIVELSDLVSINTESIHIKLQFDSTLLKYKNVYYPGGLIEFSLMFITNQIKRKKSNQTSNQNLQNITRSYQLLRFISYYYHVKSPYQESVPVYEPLCDHQWALRLRFSTEFKYVLSNAEHLAKLKYDSDVDIPIVYSGASISMRSRFAELLKYLNDLFEK